MTGKKSRIVAVHLLNDYSGSPLVFMQALKGLQAAGHPVVVHTSKSRNGFLDRLSVPFVYFPYVFFNNNLLRLIAFCCSQIILFFQLLRYRKEDVIIYVNTLLPFGAALAGAYMNKKVIYHIHESYIRPALLKRFLKFVAGKTADTVFYVSHYLQKEERIAGVNGQVIYNVLPDEFTRKAGSHSYHQPANGAFTVLMICSLKNYKGIPEFIQLAGRHSGFNFDLVLNAGQRELDQYFSNVQLPGNLRVYPVQTDLDSFYRNASLVVNLTNPSLCIETFGMTLLEAMCYGIPVIGPPVGGPAELVKNEFNGFCIDVRDKVTLDSRLAYLAAHPELMSALSKGALKTAADFDAAHFQEKVINSVQEDFIL